MTPTSHRPGDHDPIEVAPSTVAAELRERAIALLDVREPVEWEIARLPGARLVPLQTLPSAVNSLDPSADIVVYCHHGMRSAAAVEWLLERGFARVRNLAGGIDRWSIEVDATVRRY
jgi:adenylyltransferase/sulfurtransferase